MTARDEAPANPVEALGIQLGSRLRLARKSTGLTMKQLADRSGVSQPHLSQMENGKVSPSISTLYRLANALNISPQELLPVATRSLQVIRPNQVTPTPIADVPRAALARVLVGAPDRVLQVQEVLVEPDDDLGSWFSHAGEEFVYVARGAVSIHLRGEEPAALDTGEAAWYDSSIEHLWRLIEGPASLIVVSATTTAASSAGHREVADPV